LNSGYEGLSHVLLEAIDIGVPVLASRVGGNPEIVPEEQLFSVDDRVQIREKILQTLRNKKQSVLGDSFTMDKMIERTQEVLQSVCANS
jgi:glycosyltransferase involved in cell wall biosynthesis